MINLFSFIIIIIVIILVILYFTNFSDKFGNVNQQINKKVAIGFMVRNGEPYLEKNLNKIINFMNINFGKNNFDIHYFENDSTDKTIEILDKLKRKIIIFLEKIACLKIKCQVICVYLKIAKIDSNF